MFYYNTFLFTLLLSATFLNIGCVTTYTTNDLHFIKWENTDPIYSFDKASKIIGVFTAPTNSEMSCKIEFNGRTYQPKIYMKVDDNGIISKYIVEITDQVVPGNYDLVASYTKGGEILKSKTQVIVYPSSLLTYKGEDLSDIRVEEELIGYLSSITKGDYLEFHALPSSINSIPSKQFRINISGLSKNEFIHDFHIGSSNGITIPVNANKINMSILWKNPIDTNITVKLFPSDSSDYYSFSPQIKRPLILPSNKYVLVDSNPNYIVLSGEIKAPIYINHETIISDVSFEVQEINVPGYKFETLGIPENYNGIWQQKFRIVETGKTPKKFEGNIRFRIKAKAVLDKEDSGYAITSQRIYIQ
jgi:hypothetical protein